MLTPKPSSYYNGRCLIIFANPEYLKKAQLEKPCLYNVNYDKNDLENMFAPESDETIHLVEESRSKLVAHNAVKYVVLFENALEKEMLDDLKYVKSVEQEVDDLKMEIDNLKSQLETEKKFKSYCDMSCENTDLKAQLQDKTKVNAEMCNLLNKMKGKSEDTKFEKPSVVRQPNALRFQKPSAMG
ncbi:hypothetical protein Tco_0957173 [Tanacetum coccineum]